MEHPAWRAIVERIEAVELKTVDSQMEDRDPFAHGVAVGKRRAYRLVLALPEQLLREAEGKTKRWLR